MKRVLVLLLLTLTIVFARFSAAPTQECEAFNNLKHTQNSHHVVLDTKRKYRVLREHKRQYLIIVEGEHPQRWVDVGCFDISVSSMEASKKSQTTSKQTILALSWQNAFCQMHQSKRECKRALLPQYQESHFVLHGLWPQPKNNLYCNVDRRVIAMDKHKQWSRLPALDLSDETLNGIKYYMPGFVSNLHRHEWIKHGTCYGTDANTYYGHAIAMMEQFDKSKINAFFSKNRGKRVTLKQIRYLFDRSFGTNTGKRVEMKCKQGLITELWLHLGSGSDDLATLLKRGKPTRSRCHEGLVDKAGF